MNTPNWDKTFTHSVALRQFRATEQGQQDYRTMIDKLLEEGASFAVTNGHLYLSQFALTTLKDYFDIPEELR